jgi:transcriptional regulator with XRE-family HTH domain
LPRHPRSSTRLELAAFLRTRRERLLPADVGLATTKRRRTPGLRREEVAHLAGVGVTWYTWLEQGREIDVSAHFLEQVAKALCLDAEARAHLFTLAHNRPPPLASRSSFGLTASHQRMLDAFEAPAYIATACLDVLAWNDALNAVFGDLSDLSEANRNMLWLMFASPSHQAAVPNWEEAARAMLARCRIEYGRNQDDERFRTLITQLCNASREFSTWWSEHDVTIKPEGSKRFTSPLVGEMELEQHALLLEGAAGTRLVLYAPANQESAAKVSTLRQRWRGSSRKPQHRPARTLRTKSG